MLLIVVQLNELLRDFAQANVDTMGLLEERGLIAAHYSQKSARHVI